eukprot:266932_1
MSWYFVDPQGVTNGPLDKASLFSLYGSQITDSTYLWDGITVSNWTELHKVPSLHRELSDPSIHMDHVDMNALSADDIDHILNEIEDTERKNVIEEEEQTRDEVQIQSKSIEKGYKKARPTSINWNQIYLQRDSILRLVESHYIDINIQNPVDGMTLLMHSIIIGDFNLIKTICLLGADIFLKDHDGDDALDYSLVFQQYKVTQLLLLLGYELKNQDTPISEAIANKNKEAKYMMQQQFGRFKEKIVHFVTKAIRERKCFDVNLLYFAWYFTANCKENVGRNFGRHSNNAMPDPLQSKLFKTMMKTYWEVISNKSQDRAAWRWVRKHLVNSLIWYLPHPDSMIMIDDMMDESDDDETDVSASVDEKDERNVVARIVRKVEENAVDSADKLLFFLFL